MGFVCVVVGLLLKARETQRETKTEAQTQTETERHTHSHIRAYPKRARSHDEKDKIAGMAERNEQLKAPLLDETAASSSSSLLANDYEDPSGLNNTTTANTRPRTTPQHHQPQSALIACLWVNECEYECVSERARVSECECMCSGITPLPLC